VSLKNVTIVGAGALGSHLAQFLRSEAQLKVIDFDRVEAKNVLAQFHGKSAVRQLKVTALSSVMNFLWGIKIETNSNKLVENNVEQLLGHPDLIIDCLDNGVSRRVVQRYTRQEAIPCLHGALAADGAFGRVVWESFVVDDEDAAGAPTCEDGEHLPFIGIVSTYLARAAQIYLHTGKRVGFAISPVGAIQV
jgi:molybdopterin/thiamine biosynthesis adenylyltransferase